MRATRRSLLQLPVLAAVAVTGCTPDPTIQGSPGSAAEPIPPTRRPENAAVATWVAEFVDLLATLAEQPTSWGAQDVHIAWLGALRTQSEAHLSRIVAEDPVTGGPTAFPASSVSPDIPPPATPDDVLATVTAKVAEGAPVLAAAVASASSGPERLFHASIATASAASLTPVLPPIDGGAEPASFEDPAMPAALQVALSHAWALIRGLELGLGRLAGDHPLRTLGARRLDGVKELRNRILAALPGEPPDVRTWALPDAMLMPEEISAAWAVLESNMCDAIGVIVAADSSDSTTWLEAMLAQVPWVHQWGGRLPHWPGWVAAS
ncbi:hypothetical protein [Tessaracoccus sp.]